MAPCVNGYTIVLQRYHTLDHLADTPRPSPGTLAKLALVTVRPRATIRAILDQPRDRMIVPLVLLAACSSFFGDYDLPVLIGVLRQESWKLAVMIGGALIGSAASLLLLFFGFAWLLGYIGRRLEGEGTAREMRSAIAWGLAPVVWALLFRLPVSVYFALSPAGEGLKQMSIGGEKPIILNSGLASHGCGWAAAIFTVEMIVVVVWLIVTSHTVAEAHRFSAWQGLGTILLGGLVPILALVSLLLAGIFSP